MRVSKSVWMIVALLAVFAASATTAEAGRKRNLGDYSDLCLDGYYNCIDHCATDTLAPTPDLKKQCKDDCDTVVDACQDAGEKPRADKKKRLPANTTSPGNEAVTEPTRPASRGPTSGGVAK